MTGLNTIHLLTSNNVNTMSRCMNDSGSNGNSIFLPAAGFKYNDDVGSFNRYWSSSYAGREYSVCMLVPSNSKGQLSMEDDFRDNGMVIRPVCE